MADSQLILKEEANNEFCVKPSLPYIEDIICLGEYTESIAQYIARFNDPRKETNINSDCRETLKLTRKLEFRAARNGDIASLLELKALTRELERTASLLDRTYPLRAASPELQRWRRNLKELKEEFLMGELFL